MSEESTVDDFVEIDTVQDTDVIPPVEVEEVQDTDSSFEEDKQTTDEVQSDSENESDDGDVDPEMREFNFGGSKISVPFSSVNDEVAGELQNFANNINADYTRGKQEIAESRISLDIQEKSLSHLTNLNSKTLDDYAHGLRLKEDIQELSGIDLNKLRQSDPDKAWQIADALKSKQVEFQTVVEQVGRQEQEFLKVKRDEETIRFENGLKILNKKYKDFSIDKSPKLIDYVVSKGMNKKDAENWPLNPIIAEMAYKSMLYDNMQHKIQNKPKTKSVTAPIKSTKVKGRSSSKTKDPNKMTMAEYAKWRSQ